MCRNSGAWRTFALVTLELEFEAVWLAGQFRHSSAERERKVGTVMALKTRGNLVLRLLVDNGLWVRMDRVYFVWLFGNVGFDSQMHQVAFVVLNCSCECALSGTCSESLEDGLDCVGSGNCLMKLETKRKPLLWVCVYVLFWIGTCTVTWLSQAGQEWLLLLRLLQFVLVKPGTNVVVKTVDRCREGKLDPETGRYSEVVVILTELCVKITWMEVFLFWLRAAIP